MPRWNWINTVVRVVSLFYPQQGVTITSGPQTQIFSHRVLITPHGTLCVFLKVVQVLVLISFVAQIRSEFDDILLKHAQQSGAHVFQGVKVLEICFENADSTQRRRPVSLKWKSKSGNEGTVGYDWLIDASGRAGIMSTKYLNNRTFNQSLKNVAIWAYYSGGSTYAPGTIRENSPWFEAMNGVSICDIFYPHRN